MGLSVVRFDIGVCWAFEGVEKAFDGRVSSCMTKNKGLREDKTNIPHPD